MGHRVGPSVSLVPLLWAVALAVLAGNAAAADPASSGPLPRSGLAVHLGTTDGRWEVALARPGTVLVHGLALDADAAAAARRRIHAAGVYGQAAVERAGTLTPLPYADNLVDLLVADVDALGGARPSEDEILRVLRPGGEARLKRGGTWRRLTKPRPPGMDEWTHFDYGPEGNGVSHDRLVRPPKHLQWVAGVQPIQMGGNPAGFHTYTAPRVAEGRLFTEYGWRDDRRQRHRRYQARSAFNGLPLWTRENTAGGRKDWQFVAVGDRLYTFLENEGPLVALDAATGEVVRTYDAAAPRNAERQQTALRVSRSRIYMTSGPALYVLRADSGALVWKHTEPEGNLFYPSVSAEAGKVFVAVAPEVYRHASRWPVSPLTSILCLNLATGRPVWRNTEVAGAHIGQLVYADGHLALFGSGAIGGGEKPFIGAIRAADGKLLWRDTFRKEYNRFGYNMLVRDGTLYYADAWRIYAHDLATGEASVPFDDRGYNMRCNRFSATERLLIYGLVAYVDRSWHGEFQSIARSGCAHGAVPACGMVYFTPNACHCITQVRGHVALAPEPLREPVPDGSRLTTGAGMPSEGPSAAAPAAGTVGPIARDWESPTGTGVDRETDPVEAGGRRYVAIVHRHRLEARDSGGAVLWAFTAGGRISSPPVLHGGLCLFGAHDGYIYAVGATDGRLAWRFLAAPYHRKIVSCGQLESAWPVFGVVMHDGLVCAAAGLHPEAGGGIYVWGLEPASGRIRWKQVLHRRPIEHDGKSRIAIRGNRVLGGVLERDGDCLRLPGITFAPDTPPEELRERLQHPPKEVNDFRLPQ